MSLRFLTLAAVFVTLASACANDSDLIAAPDGPRRIIPCEGIECQGSGPGGGGAPAGLSIAGITPEMCANVTSYADTDLDMMNDTCEETLATSFAPLMKQVDATTFAYDFYNGRMGGEYYHAVYSLYCGTHPCASSIRIAYLPAYYRDVGAYNTVAHGFDWGHPGDSEFMIVDLIYDAGRWKTNGVFLSAHCGSFLTIPWVGTLPFPSDPYCRWYSFDDMEYVDGVSRGAPVVYVADGTNANYRSLGECDGGTYALDTCHANRLVRFPVSLDFNVGSSIVNPGSVAARRNTTLADPNRRECLWCQTTPFGGWQNDAAIADATPYGVILSRFESPGYYAGGNGCAPSYNMIADPLRATIPLASSGARATPTAPPHASRALTPTGPQRVVWYDPCNP